MNCDEVHKLERTMPKALWALASLHPGDPNASELLAILDELDDQERRAGPQPPNHSISMRFVTLFQCSITTTA